MELEEVEEAEDDEASYWEEAEESHSCRICSHRWRPVLMNSSVLGGDEGSASSSSASASCFWSCCSWSCFWCPILELGSSNGVGGDSMPPMSSRLSLLMEMERAEVTISFIAALMIET